jgi:hypothetical protein
MSANHVEPDLAAEVFVLEEPFLESPDIPAPSDDSALADIDDDSSPEIGARQ